MSSFVQCLPFFLIFTLHYDMKCKIKVPFICFTSSNKPFLRNPGDLGFLLIILLSYITQLWLKKGKDFKISSCVAMGGNMWQTERCISQHTVGFLCVTNLLTVRLGTKNPWLMVFHVCGIKQWATCGEMFLQQQTFNTFWETTSDSQIRWQHHHETRKTTYSSNLKILGTIYFISMFRGQVGQRIQQVVHISSHYYIVCQQWYHQLTTHKVIWTCSTHPVVFISHSLWDDSKPHAEERKTDCQLSHHQLPLTTTQKRRTGNSLLYQRALTQSVWQDNWCFQNKCYQNKVKGCF